MFGTCGNVKNFRSYCHGQSLIYCVLSIVWLIESAYGATEGESCNAKTLHGMCLPVSKCTTLDAVIKDNLITAKEIPNCGYTVHEEMICCPILPGVRTTTTTTTTPSPPYAAETTTLDPIAMREYIRLLVESLLSNSSSQLNLEDFMKTATTSSTTTTTSSPMNIYEPSSHGTYFHQTNLNKYQVPNWLMESNANEGNDLPPQKRPTASVPQYPTSLNQHLSILEQNLQLIGFSHQTYTPRTPIVQPSTPVESTSQVPKSGFNLFFGPSIVYPGDNGQPITSAANIPRNEMVNSVNEGNSNDSAQTPAPATKFAHNPWLANVLRTVTKQPTATNTASNAAKENASFDMPRSTLNIRRDTARIMFPADNILDVTHNPWLSAKQTSTMPAQPIIPTAAESPTSSTNEPTEVRFSQRPAIRACKELEAILPLPISPHIIGGTSVELGEFPHMAAIGFTTINSDVDYSFNCGGSLIARRFVLTAAHCVNSLELEPAIVLLGANNISQVEDYAMNITVKQVHIHPNYTNSQKYDDIAILELEKEAPINEFIQPACLHTEADVIPENSQYWVTGWGVVNIQNRMPSKRLLKAPLQIVPLDTCSPSFENHLSQGVLDKQLCARDAKLMADACQGDSGGPLSVPYNLDLHRYRVVGIVSTGFSCGTSVPGLYTRVISYLDYIEKIVWPENS